MIAAAVLVACGHQSPDKGEGEHTDGHGVLSFRSGIGGQSLLPPSRLPWYATFGDFHPCTMDPSKHVQLRGVRFETDPSPITVRAWLRSVPDASKRGETRPIDWVPIGSAKGAPGRWEGDTVLGTFTRDIAGFNVSQPCARYEPGAARTDALFVMEVNSRGAEIKRVLVDYTLDGKPKTLAIRWKMAACGSAVKDSDVCP